MTLNALRNRNIDRICIIRLSALGDVCHFLPTWHAIRNRYPDAQITWVIGKIEHQLVGDLPNTNFVIFDKQNGLSEYRKFSKTIKGQQFDLLIHAQTSLRANLIALLTPASIKLGFDRDRARELHSLVCTHHIAPAPDQHQVDDFLDFAVAIAAPQNAVTWTLPVPQEAKSFADALFDQHRPLLAINSCSSPSKRVHRNWHTQGYIDACNFAATKFNAQIVLCGGPTSIEIEKAATIEHGSDADIINLAGKTSLKQLCAVLQRADVLLSSDSGPVHIANALGTRVVALHAATNPLQIGPYGQLDLCVDHYPQAIQAEYSKPLDMLPWGTRAHGEDVMESITVEEVQQKLVAAFRA